MHNTLLIDNGNTSLKWGLVVGHELDRVSSFTHQQGLLDQQLDQTLGKIAVPATVWVASVAPQSVQDVLRLWIRRQWSVPVRFMQTKKAACGVTCAYQKPEDLGVDRWAAIIAAYQLYPQGVCVIDCGTAITVDVVRSDGQHLGGYILPGFELMQQSLYSNTAIVRKNSVKPSTEWGNSTASCMFLGGRKAIVSLVESTIERLQAAGVCNPALIFTGSASKEVASLIEIDYKIREHLVLEGLLMVAEDEAK